MNQRRVLMRLGAALGVAGIVVSAVAHADPTDPPAPPIPPSPPLSVTLLPPPPPSMPAQPALPGLPEVSSAPDTNPDNPEEPAPVIPIPVHQYIAMGDSFVSAPFQDPIDEPSGWCRRSFSNYPSLVAQTLNLQREDTFLDESCSGGTTKGLESTVSGFEGFGGQSTALIDYVTPTTDLVTITMGMSNDTLSAVLFRDCGRGNCAEKVAATPELADMDEFMWKVTRTVASAARHIHEISPTANVLIVGYLRAGSQWCDAWGIYNEEDTALIDHLQARTNEALRNAAFDSGSYYVDVNTHGDHGVCSEIPWVRGDGSHSGAPIALHPTPEGHRAVADDILTMLGRPPGQ